MAKQKILPTLRQLDIGECANFDLSEHNLGSIQTITSALKKEEIYIDLNITQGWCKAARVDKSSIDIGIKRKIEALEVGEELTVKYGNKGRLKEYLDDRYEVDVERSLVVRRVR